jgi:hypothetical protein
VSVPYATVLLTNSLVGRMSKITRETNSMDEYHNSILLIWIQQEKYLFNMLYLLEKSSISESSDNW